MVTNLATGNKKKIPCITARDFLLITINNFLYDEAYAYLTSSKSAS